MSETNTRDTIRWSDTDAMEDLASFVNASGKVNGDSLVDRFAVRLEATGRDVLDDLADVPLATVPGRNGRGTRTPGGVKAIALHLLLHSGPRCPCRTPVYELRS